MKPKRYPYSGKKKQSHEEIAELKKQIAVNKSIAKSLESIDTELKARNTDRKKLLEEAERIEKKVIEIQADPFGLENLKATALADKAKKKE